MYGLGFRQKKNNIFAQIPTHTFFGKQVGKKSITHPPIYFPAFSLTYNLYNTLIIVNQTGSFILLNINIEFSLQF